MKNGDKIVGINPVFGYIPYLQKFKNATVLFGCRRSKPGRFSIYYTNNYSIGITFLGWFLTITSDLSATP